MLSHWVAAIIKDVAKSELKDKKEKHLDDLWDLVNSIFKIWKLEHGDKQPKPIHGLLGTGRAITFDDAEAWECAGLAFPSRLGLALMLIGQDDPDFMALLKIAKLNTILALLIDKESDSFRNDDMFFAYDILLREQSSRQGALSALKANVHYLQAGIEQEKNLAKGNPAAAKSKSFKAGKYHELWKTWAKEIWCKNPNWSVERVAEHVLDAANRCGHKMANKNPYQVSTIIKNITGVKQTLKT